MTTPDEPRPDVPKGSQQGAGPSPADGPHDEPEPAWMKLLAPLRSEGAAFRLLIAVVIICAAVAIIALVLRTI